VKGSMIDSAPLFSELTNEQRSLINDRLTLQAFGTGDVIYVQGQPALAMYFIGSGRVRLLVNEDAVLANLSQGSLFGDSDVLTGQNYSVTSEAASNAALWMLTASDLGEIVAVQPEVGRKLRVAAGITDDQTAERHLRRLGLLRGLSAEQISEVADHLKLQHFPLGQVIFSQGSEGEVLYIVEEGQVSVQRASAGTPGAEVLETLGTGDFFGEDALLSGEAHRADAVTLTPVSVWALAKSDFETLVLRYPSLLLNLSRALSRRLYQTGAAPVVMPAAAPLAAPAPWVTPVAAPRVAPRVAPAPQPTFGAPRVVPAPQPAAVAPTPQAGTPSGARGPSKLSTAIDSVASWFGAQSAGAKLRLIAVVVLLVWLIGVALPSAIISLLSNVDTPKVSDSLAAAGIQNRIVLIALAADLPVQTTPTYTPWPTETPIPTETFTPTDTPIPTETPVPTATPEPPTPTPVPVRAVVIAAAPPPAPAPAAAVAQAPASSAQFKLTEMRRLTPCENKGKHHIFVKVVDAAGNPVDGVTLVQAPADQIGSVLDKAISGAKGPGLAEFVMWKHAEYAIYESDDGANPGNSDIAKPLHSNFVDEATCSDGEGGNTLFHNSWNVIFQKAF